MRASESNNRYGGMAAGFNSSTKYPYNNKQNYIA